MSIPSDTGKLSALLNACGCFFGELSGGGGLRGSSSSSTIITSGFLTFLALPAAFTGESMGSEGGVCKDDGGGDDDCGGGFDLTADDAALALGACLGAAAAFGAAPAFGAPKKLARVDCFMLGG